jgi:hypothetical protein
MVIAISPNYTDAHFHGNPSLDEKITIFEDRVLGWQLDIAEELRKRIERKDNQGRPIRHGGFALVSILFSYFEMIAQYEKGESSEQGSKKCFGKGLESIFPGEFSDDQKNLIYRRIRCGMYHNGLIKEGALIDRSYANPIQIENGLVKVNPHKLSLILKAHFRKYIDVLRSPNSTTERSNFEKTFSASKKV